MDDILIGTETEASAKVISDKIGSYVKFDHEKEIPITFVGMVNDHNGVDIEQHADCIHVTSKSHIERLLKTHGWETESPKSIIDDGSLKRPIAPISPDCLQTICLEKGPAEGTVEHS